MVGQWFDGTALENESTADTFILKILVIVSVLCRVSGQGRLGRLDWGKSCIFTLPVPSLVQDHFSEDESILQTAV